MKRIEIVSQFLRWFFLIAAALNLVCYFFFHFILKPGVPFDLLGIHFGFSTNIPLAVGTLLYSGLLGIPSVLVSSGLFYLLSQLFYEYANHQFFTLKVVRYYAAIGWLLIVQVFIDILEVFLQAHLTQVGQNINLNFSSVPFSQLITGLVVLCISWVFSHVLVLQETEELTV